MSRNGRVDGVAGQKGNSSDSESHDGAVGAGDGSQSVVGCADGAYGASKKSSLCCANEYRWRDAFSGRVMTSRSR